MYDLSTIRPVWLITTDDPIELCVCVSLLSVCLSVCLSCLQLSCAKTAERIEVGGHV